MSRTNKRKPSPQIRKPGRASSEREAFLAGEPEADTPRDLTELKPPTEPPAASSRSSTRAKKAKKRRPSTILFEEELYKELKMYCALHDAEMSQTVARALRLFFDDPSPPDA